jgi:hypothetical protein
MDFGQTCLLWNRDLGWCSLVQVFTVGRPKVGVGAYNNFEICMRSDFCGEPVTHGRDGGK